MTIVSPMGQLRPVFADKNGKRLSGGKVYTYEPGTLTPKATYTDALNLIPNTNPIDLDKYGEADIFLNGDYRIRVVDRHGVMIDDYDNLMAWATKRYLDLALSGFASGASKFYPTLADANADIANIAVNQPVNIGELENGGLWFKESTESTTLTKAPYDTLELAKQYSNQKQVVQEQYINDLFAAQTQNIENLINQQGVSLQQLDDYYNYLMQRLAQIAVDKGWEASFVVDASGKNQQEVNNFVLYSVPSAADLRLTNPIKKGQKVYLESHMLDNGKGGGEFIATQKVGLADNNGTVFSSPDLLLFWVRADQSNPLPEWFGAKGDGVADDVAALTAYFIYMNTIQTEAKLIDNHLINSSVVIPNTYGIDMSQGGKITVNADVDGLVINNVARMSQFKNFRFSVNLPTASDKALMLVKVDSHIIGAVFDGFYVNDLTLSRTWTGRRFDAPTNAGKGIFGGTRITNTQAQGLKTATHFTNTNFFANGIYFGESFGSYNQDDVLVDRYLALSTFVNYQAQENTSSVVKFSDTCTTGNRNLFKNVHNWDNGLPSIIFGKGTAQNRWEMMYPFKVIDYGFDNAPVSSDLDTQDVRDNASATYLDILSVHNTLGDFRRLFNRETVTGTGVIKEGSGILANGKQRHSVILDVPAVGDTAMMTAFDSAAMSSAVGRGFAERYSKAFFIAGFTLASALVDDYSFLIGLSGIGTTDGTFYNGGVYLTCVGGNFAIVQTNNYSSGLPNAANCTVIATLKALDTKHHSIGIVSNSTGATGNQSVHFDNVWAVDHTQNIGVSKSPVIANSYKTTNKTALLVHKVQFKQLVSQGWI